MERNATSPAQPGATSDDAVPQAEIVDAPTSPSGVAVSAMDEAADTDRESLGDVAPGEEAPESRPSSARHRRRTVVSPIPSLLAASMSPAAPSKGATPRATPLSRALAKARATLSSGDLLSAYHDAEAAVAAAVQSGELSSPLFRKEQAFLMQVYTAYLGDLDNAPVLNVPAEVWENESPSAEARAILARVNGLRTLRDILHDTGLDAFEQLRTAARLFGSGHIGWS